MAMVMSMMTKPPWMQEAMQIGMVIETWMDVGDDDGDGVGQVWVKLGSSVGPAWVTCHSIFNKNSNEP